MDSRVAELQGYLLPSLSLPCSPVPTTVRTSLLFKLISLIAWLFRIANIYEMFVLSVNVSESLRLMERSFAEVSVNKSDVSVSDCVDSLHCFDVYEHNSVVACV